MNILLFIGVVLILIHSKITFSDKKLLIEVDFNRIIGKIKDFANKL